MPERRISLTGRDGRQRMEVDLSDFKKPLVWVGVITALVTGAALMLVTQMYRLPDIDQRERDQDKALDSKFAEMDRQFGAVHADLSAMDGRYQQRLKSMSLTVQNLKMNVLLLCEQRRPISKTCDVKALVEQARNASQTQAEFFAAADVKLNPGSTEPVIATEGLSGRLPAFVLHEHSTAKTDKPSIANAILWSSAAQSARWHQEGQTIVVVFANGTASFDLSAPNTTRRLPRLGYR